jgi:hypothetical protein
MAFIPDQRLPLLMGVISLLILLAVYGVRVWRGRDALPQPIEPIAAEAHHFGEL